MKKTARERAAGRLAAFEALVASHEGGLLRYAARLVNDMDSAQTIVQDTFVKLYRAWPEALEPSPNLTSWLYRVTHNGAVDHMRKEARLHLLHVRQAAEREETVPPDRGSGFRISEEAERASEALRRLNVRERELVVLKVYEDKSYAEISEITGLTVGNVGYILHHAMRKLAAEMKKVKGS